MASSIETHVVPTVDVFHLPKSLGFLCHRRAAATPGTAFPLIQLRRVGRGLQAMSGSVGVSGNGVAGTGGGTVDGPEEEVGRSFRVFR